MESIENWAEEYAVNNNIEYNDLVCEALENYKDYLSCDKQIYDYIRSDKFKRCIGELNGLLSKNNNIWSLDSIENINDKTKYCDEYNEELQDKILAGYCELLRITNKDVVKAYCILSYENDNYGQYAFLHKIRFTKEFNTNEYNIIENKIAKYIKSKNSMYLDRLIIDGNEDDIRKMGYCVLAENVSIKISLENYEKQEIDYKYNLCQEVDERYFAISSIMPLRFEKKLDKCYKVSFEYGDFYIYFSIAYNSSLVNIYVYNFENYYKYIEKVYTIIEDIMNQEGVNTIYTSIPKQHIMLLNKNHEILKKIFWIRKNV